MTGIHRRIADEVYDRLRDDVVSGARRPGDRIDPTRVAADLGVSRTPVREAILRLDAEGLVERRPYRGVVVAAVDLAVAAEVAALRIHLETLAVRLAVPRLAAGDLAALEEVHARLVAGLGGPDPQESFRQANREFHLTLYRAAGAPVLVRSIEEAQVQAERIRRHVDVRQGHAVDDHAVILAACRAGDVEAAVDATRAHVLAGYRDLLPADGPPIDERVLAAVTTEQVGARDLADGGGDVPGGAAEG